MIRRRAVLAGFAPGLGLAGPPLLGEPRELLAYAHQLAPLSYGEGKQLHGLFVELLQDVCNLLELPLRLELQPLSRALKTRGHGFIVFPLDRQSEREGGYRWIGPVLPRRVLIYRLSQRQDLDFQGLALLGNRKIGVNRGTGTHKKLLDSGLHPMAQLEVANSYASALKMLLAGRTDYLAMNELAASWNLRQLGLPPETLSSVAVLDATGFYWYGVSPQDDVLAARLQHALEQLQSLGRVEALKRHYGL
ncbi:transporter substrate-binding domain-containing protein [Paucibacter sp. APW11]|uniref:Transporter substrate-binding domain-containing protein n=1 Tax=Roseateles aquae TaxID=3077235 RepID=A0ABU3PIK5_9BURK|nr:transporter substrate-binding domain-containing protein [Paucibacter sp. APW11]MDT9002395.1 transporter substrate-binding domain-containing protein [Paucibacter sp. APW11]